MDFVMRNGVELRTNGYLHIHGDQLTIVDDVCIENGCIQFSDIGKNDKFWQCARAEPHAANVWSVAGTLAVTLGFGPNLFTTVKIL